MNITELLEKVTIKDVVITSSLAFVGYHLYNLREAVKHTIHRHTPAEDKEGSSVRSETQLSAYQGEDFTFGFRAEDE